jgi:hypothetical protein
LTIGSVLDNHNQWIKKTIICELRFNLRIERFTIQILLYNQILIFLEQSTKQYTISNQTYMNKIIMLSNQKHNAIVIEELNRLCNQLV